MPSVRRTEPLMLMKNTKQKTKTELKQPANLFISYRREDSAGHTGRLFDSIRKHFGERIHIFMDVESIAPGKDWVNAIEDAVGSSQALVVVIGKQWLSVKKRQRQRRLDDPNDSVRVEVEAALSRNITVIPVLVQGASMPSLQELPETMSNLIRRNAIEVTDTRWNYDVGRLLNTIEQELNLNIPARRRFPESVVTLTTVFTVFLLAAILWQWRGLNLLGFEQPVNTPANRVKPLLGQWRHSQIQPGGEILPLGTFNVSEESGELVMGIVEIVNRRDIAKPIRLYNVRFDGETWIFKADFEDEGSGEFKFKRIQNDLFRGYYEETNGAQFPDHQLEKK